MKKKLLSLLLAAAMVASLTACGSSADNAASEPAADQPAEPAAEDVAESGEEQPVASGEAITLKVFSNLPDRTSGQGLVEQTLFDAYMAENPNVTIEVEALSDEEYKTKFKAYASGSQMPDLVNVWGQPGFLDEVMEAGLLAELNPDDYADYNFLPGSLDGFSKDGKLYGLSRNTDVMCFFYNQKIFNDNGWEVPTTYDELLDLGDKIRAAGLQPVAMYGGDKWSLYIYIHDIAEQLDGSGIMAKTNDAIKNHDFSDPTFKQATDLFVEAVDRGLFQNGFESNDGGTAKNLFTNGQAAMYYTGSWEMSMVNDMDIPDEVRENIRVFLMPIPEGGKGSATTITAWHGGGYSVTANAANKEEAIKLLNYMFRPDGWTKLAWENGVCMSAQNFGDYVTGSETEVQKQLIDLVANATDLSGTTLGDLGSSEFKTVCEDKSQELAAKKITADEYLKALEDVGK